MSQIIPMLDTHQHLIYPDRWPYSWTDDIPALAKRGFRYEDYTKLVEQEGVAGTIFIETSPDDPHWREETKFVYSLASQPGSLIKGVIANCRPENDGFEAYVDSVKHEKLVGVRRILHVVPDEVSQHVRFIENIRWLGEQDLTFDMCFLARQLPIARELADQCPDTQLILDHCGVPDIAAGAMSEWRQNIRELARMTNVFCKISGVLAYCKAGEANLEAIEPYVDHCIECFGSDRLVWGSDWPVVVINSTLPEWIRIARQLVAQLSEREQRKILHDNAARIYLKS
jgi:predicted TIM-barrel fold metal-dependent hydrolase